ncbi:DUF1097 domain-containing protein [Geodermatophilus sp. YIM 151500]|uniref:DUF1097 domain-containing protein n=1 Tax=Geodermatophilus sp. YIM 151500 TaxID=2984531 RepID=UPI0021E4081F|nr:DUF1097 domain-containing protein [Geodermatophilus sp. YIM 151500]MCV2489902.1 DUF1097 domain-containing protein [Geodermatophilus sp. YIM 151500]
MKRLIALGISIGVLAGLWTVLASSVPAIGGWEAPLVVWIGFAAWACFYAAGGRLPGLTKGLASNVSGLLWGFALLWGATAVREGSVAVLGLFVALAAFGMCVQAAWSPLAFIPGAFVGAAAFFGNAGVFWSTLASLVAGALLAYASELLGDLVEKALPSRGAARPLRATTNV